jgi:hypothetical protein
MRGEAETATWFRCSCTKLHTLGAMGLGSQCTCGRNLWLTWLDTLAYSH